MIRHNNNYNLSISVLFRVLSLTSSYAEQLLPDNISVQSLPFDFASRRSGIGAQFKSFNRFGQIVVRGTDGSSVLLRVSALP